ncbi:SDR family NAD(P)-dependent oxidoreductase, partial [Priestia megaterium]|uniref:SDR family NAD(P)-dependent oxidoreductase n=1 Tax=Priestia megaterium TaxID=1404 RepID=UPI0035B58D7F
PHILVTGSTRGIGAAIVAALQARGARVIGPGRPDGSDVRGADLEDPSAADALWARALERLDGRIDVLVNNAGVFEAAPVD